MLEKYGDLREDSKSDDVPSATAKYAEKDGFRVLSKEAIHITTVGFSDLGLGVNRGGDAFTAPTIIKLSDEAAARVRPGYKG